MVPVLADTTSDLGAGGAHAHKQLVPVITYVASEPPVLLRAPPGIGILSGLTGNPGLAESGTQPSGLRQNPCVVWVVSLRGKENVWVQDSVWVQRVLDPSERREFSRTSNQMQPTAFGCPYAVLSGDAAFDRCDGI